MTAETSPSSPLCDMLITTVQASPLRESAPHPCGEREPDGDTGFRGGLTCAVQLSFVMVRHGRACPGHLNSRGNAVPSLSGLPDQVRQ